LNGHQFYRQKIIGSYIADFYCPLVPQADSPGRKSRLVVEVDGGQHYSAEGKEKDRMRDDNITRAGITVLRFSDRELLENVDALLEKITHTLSR
jgi:very-short-patch-repair endonuclease